MALRAGYKGFKKLAAGLKMIRPGLLGLDKVGVVDLLSDTFIKSIVTVDYVEPGTGVTLSNRTVYKEGSMVDIFISISNMPDTAEDDVIVGIVPFTPKQEFVFGDVHSASSPFSVIGSFFIRRATGEIVLKKGSMGGITTGYLSVCYMGNPKTNAKNTLSGNDPNFNEQPKTTKKSTKKTTTTKEEV